MSEVMIYGLFPPPIGGVSVHIRRFVAFLRSRGVSFEFAHPNPAEGSAFPHLLPLEFFRRALASRARIVHVHGFQHRGMHLILTALSVAFGKKVVITIHDQWFADDYRQLRGFKRLAARLCYASAARIIAVNAQTDFLFVPTTRIVHIPAFLPPTSDEADPSALPPAIHELRARMKVVLTANAYRILFHKGQDLYGLDLSIDLMGRIIGTGNRDVGFIFVIPDVRHPDYLDAMRTRLKDLGLLDRFLILTQPLPYPAVIDICDVFLRPTTSDGDAISLREALYAGVPAIASDAVRRPEGTILFRNRDIDDLFSKAMTAITDCRAGRRRERARFAHCGEQILEVYRALGASV